VAVATHDEEVVAAVEDDVEERGQPGADAVVAVRIGRRAPLVVLVRPARAVCESVRIDDGVVDDGVDAGQTATAVGNRRRKGGERDIGVLQKWE